MQQANTNVAQPERQSSQLSLPTGPLRVLRGGRREPASEIPFMAACRETTTDRDGKKLSGSRKVVFLALASRVSPAKGMTCWPSLATIGRDSGLHVATVVRALVDLERGLLISVERGGGRRNNVYTVLPVVSHSIPKAKPALAQCDSSSRTVRDKEEGRADQDPKTLLSSDGAQTQDRAPKPKRVQGDEEVNRSIFPSQDQEAPQWKHPRQVSMLFAVARKLGREVTDTEARAFEQLSHEGRRRTLAPLLAEEQLLAAEGSVPAPPKAAPSPRQEIYPMAKNTMRVRPTCADGHRWTQPASDGISNCLDCDSEKMEEK